MWELGPFKETEAQREGRAIKAGVPVQGYSGQKSRYMFNLGQK